MADIRDALRSARQKLDSESGSLDAQVLLGHVLGVERAYLLAHPEQTISPEQDSQFSALVERLAQGEPLAYLLGRRAFYDREFQVTPAVLIPRPETELLLEQALNFVNEHPDARVVDVGTGSGALAVTLAAHCLQAQVYAIDISPEALVVARGNAGDLAGRITFLEGDLLTPLIERKIKVDMVMANLPYIASDDLHTLDVSKYEPRLALDGGADGLDLIRQLLRQAPDVCNPRALILLEIGADQGTETQALAREMLSVSDVTILKDYAGHDRVVRIASIG